MAVRMRLMRMGKKKQPMYRVVVVDGRAQRDSRYLEQIGRYEPLHDPSLIEIDKERAADWLAKGAQPTETVEKLLNITGVMDTMKVRAGKVHVVGGEGPGPDAQAPSEPAAAEAAAEADQDEPEAVGASTEEE